MAHFEEVLANVEKMGARVERKIGSIVVVFAPELSRYDLVVLTADVLSSEQLPFNGNYSVRNEEGGLVLEIWSA